MSFEDLLKERYAVRNFSDRTIEKEKLNKILEAGRLAPTAINEQPQRIFVLKSPDALCKVRSICRYGDISVTLDTYTHIKSEDAIAEMERLDYLKTKEA